MLEFLEWTAVEITPPEMFGPFHLTAVFLCIVPALLYAKRMKKKSEDERIRSLRRTGIFMAVTEVYKQLFLYYIVNGSEYSFWWFPFQLCSVPMYLCLILPKKKGRVQNAILTFFVSYTLLGALCALLYPQDMLRPWLALTVHAFLWHGLLLAISFSVIASHMAEPSKASFLDATRLFLVLCVIATVINVLSEGHGMASTYADMFYISPYHITEQPVFHDVALTLGIPAGNLFYILMIILFCAFLHMLYCRFTLRG